MKKGKNVLDHVVRGKKMRHISGTKSTWMTGV